MAENAAELAPATENSDYESLLTHTFCCITIYHRTAEIHTHVAGVCMCVFICCFPVQEVTHCMVCILVLPVAAGPLAVERVNIMKEMFFTIRTRSCLNVWNGNSLCLHNFSVRNHFFSSVTVTP